MCSSTGILGVALNVTRLTHVTHRGYLYDVLSFVQGVGQMGREDPSMPCTSVILLPTGTPDLKTKLGEDPFGSHLLCISLNDDQHCHQLLIQQFLDRTAEPCTLLPSPTNL